MSNTNERQRRGQISARLDPAVIEVVERGAEAERRPVSSVVRNVLEDWASERRTQHAAENPADAARASR